MFAYCGSNPVVKTDPSGQVPIWWYFIETHDWGHVHKLVSLDISAKYGVQREVWVDRGGNPNGGRMDIFSDGSVWEIKHGTKNILVAQAQARTYLGSHTSSDELVESLGRVGAFSSGFPFEYAGCSYYVHYSTKADGAIIYEVYESESRTGRNTVTVPAVISENAYQTAATTFPDTHSGWTSPGALPGWVFSIGFGGISITGSPAGGLFPWMEQTA